MMGRATTWAGYVSGIAMLALALALAWAPQVSAAGAFPNQQGSGAVGLQGTISTSAPKNGATITTPSNGAVFSTVPITVNGTCPANVIVKIFANNVFVGSAFCANGSYSVQVSLFSGQNDLVARVYDALDQTGPDSNLISVIFNDSQFAQFGTRIALSSIYAQRGAPPGQEITWPILLTGGSGPYAISVDWGDGTTADVFSQDIAGTITIKHTYKTAGIYKVIVKAVDKNGATAFLQLVGQATGATQNTSAKDAGANAIVKKEVLWWPALLMLPLIVATFWVGRRSELYSIRKQLEKSRDQEIS